MPQPFVLYWDTHTLYGWEKRQSIEVVDSFVHGLEKGDCFPPVPIIAIPGCNNEFGLHYSAPGRIGPRGFPITDGGHHRALAHYMAGKALPCVLYDQLERSNGVIRPQSRRTIDSLELVNDLEEYHERRQSSSQMRRYRPGNW